MARFKRLASVTCVLAAFAAALPLAGCGSVGGTTMMTYNRGKTAPGMDTVEDGSRTYALYPNNSGNPLRRLRLRDGDKYGFVERNGEIVGLVQKWDGAETVIPLEATLATAYYWKKAKKSDEDD